MNAVIDADTHISESEEMWKMMAPEMQPRRPVLLKVPEDTWFGNRDVFWLIDGDIYPKPAGKGSFNLMTPSAAKVQLSRKDSFIPSRDLTDISARLADMDKHGIGVQVIYPTLFLVYNTGDVELEIALCRAYNRFLAQACAKAPDRLKWVAVLPLQSIKESIDEIRFAKQNGAVGIFFRGIEGDKTLDHPYLFPMYKQNLSICIHTGCGVQAILEMFDIARNHTFGHTRIMPLIGFRDLVANKIPGRFPDLRFGFIEAAASWVPFLIHILRRLLRDKWKHGSSVDLFREYRLYVACEADEDISYIAQYTGEDNLLIGSDYPHTDPSREADLVGVMHAREDISPQFLRKLLQDNARNFYAI